MPETREAELRLQVIRTVIDSENRSTPKDRSSKIDALDMVYKAYDPEMFEAGFTVSATNIQAEKYESLYVFKDKNGIWYVDTPLDDENWKKVYAQNIFDEREVKMGPELDPLIETFNTKELTFPKMEDIQNMAAQGYSLSPIAKEGDFKSVTEFKSEDGVFSATANKFSPS